MAPDAPALDGRRRWLLPFIFLAVITIAVVIAVTLVVVLVDRSKPKTPYATPYRVTFSLYQIDEPQKQILAKVEADDPDSGCYYLEDTKEIIKSTLDGLGDEAEVAFLTYGQAENSVSMTGMMSRSDSMTHLDTIPALAGVKQANELAAMKLYSNKKTESELVYFVPCDEMCVTCPKALLFLL
ncbi:unnamed protein product, partial [Mesorhabditis spiculigera]